MSLFEYLEANKSIEHHDDNDHEPGEMLELLLRKVEDKETYQIGP